MKIFFKVTLCVAVYIFFIIPALVQGEGLQCVEGEIIQSFLVTPAVAEVSHEEIVWVSKSIHQCIHNPHITCVFRPHHGWGYWKTTKVIDTPASEAVYEDRCVSDSTYTPPTGEEDEETINVPSEPVIVPPSPSGSGIPQCIMEGTCPCFSNWGDNFQTCVKQFYPKGKVCQLVPIRTCVGLPLNQDWCTPEPYKCYEEAPEELKLQVKLLSHLVSELASIINSLFVE